MVDRRGLSVVFADRVERLWEALAERIRARRDPFERVVVATPSRVVERKAELAVARMLGIAAGLALTRLPRELEARVKAASGVAHVLSPSLTESLVRDVLLTPERLEAPALADVRRYVAGEAGTPHALVERRACELAARLARLYASYTLDRPEQIEGWLAGAPDESPTAAWQSALLREALGRFEGTVAPLSVGLQAIPRAAAGDPLVVLGYSYLSRLELGLLLAIARTAEVLVLAPAPCAEFWEDATRRSVADGSTDAESPLLASWGTASREHVAALDAATDYDATRLFAESDESTRLGRLQASIRERRAVTPATGAPDDRSLALVAAPSLRREVETMAGEIWARVHAAASTERPLRFPDIAVWVPARDRELYLPQIETVFAEAHEIPWSGVDLALASRSRVVEALLRIVGLVASGPTRAGLLDVLLHPLVLARVPGEPAPEAIAAAVDRLGVLFGGDAGDLPSTYAADPRAIDLEQGIERLALGTMMLGERSGDDRFFVQDGRQWLPEELDVEGAPTWIALLRSLSADVARARAASLPLDRWARFFVALAETYVVADATEQAEHRRALSALRQLGGPTFESAATLGCTAACELAIAALESLPAAKGASDRGVLVGALGPHRASDHRVVFVLGLGESRFPAREIETGLDVREDRRACEVMAEDRDRLALLEAVVAAKDALVLSWVARDEQTGDDIAAAHALDELRRAVPDVPVARPPLRRDVALRDALARDPSAQVAALAFPIAAAEARARALGDADRARWAASPLPLRDLVMDLGPADERRALLGLEPIPPRPSETSTAPLRVSLDQVRQFLDCPVQASARRFVGGDDDDDARTRDAEPFELERRAHDLLVRALVLGALDGTAPTVEALAARRAAHGLFPLGAFGARARARAERDARTILEAVRRARPTASSARAVRFGAGREHAQAAERALDPLVLGVLPDGRALELVGTTAPLLGSETEPLVLDFARRRAGEQARVAELRLALRAFVDHAALALAPGAPPPRPRRALAVAGERATEIRFQPIRPDLARRWLTSLATQLALEPQTSFLPIESVLRVAHLFTSGSPSLEKDLARSIEVVRGPKWNGGRTQWGPLRDAVKLPAPAGAARLAGQRFSFFFAQLHEPAITTPKRGVS